MQIAAPLNSEAIPGLQWIEIATSLQIPSFQIIGLPSPEVAEARERVRAAIEASGLEFPRRRVVLNLSPASVRKRGTGIDLAMAVAILHASRGSPAPDSPSVLAWGELGLDGTLKPVGQVLRAVYAGWKAGVSRILLCEAELGDALRALSWIREAGEFAGPAPALLAVKSLREAWEILVEGKTRETAPRESASPAAASSNPALSPAPLLALAPAVERAVCVAAAGCHHILLLGPRGTGKSHALEWLCWLQPPPHPVRRLQHALLAEVAGLNGTPGFSGASDTDGERVPIRRVSSQVRPGALIGSATPEAVRPGEFSLADGGLLVADEFPEWPRDSREILREPLERGKISLSRAHAAQGTLELPARFALAANGNLCPCGGWPPELPRPDTTTMARPPRCRCSIPARERYLSRLSGPVLDRMDLVLLVLSPRRGRRKNSARSRKVPPEACAAELADRVRATRAGLVSKWGEVPGRLSSASIDALLRERPAWVAALDAVADGSLRARHKVARVALSLAEWDGAVEPTFAHFAEAAAYRPEKLGLCEK